LKRQLSLLDLPTPSVAPTVWNTLDHDWRNQVVSMLARLMARAALSGQPELVATQHGEQDHD